MLRGDEILCQYVVSDISCADKYAEESILLNNPRSNVFWAIVVYVNTPMD